MNLNKENALSYKTPIDYIQRDLEEIQNHFSLLEQLKTIRQDAIKSASRLIAGNSLNQLKNALPDLKINTQTEKATSSLLIVCIKILISNANNSINKIETEEMPLLVEKQQILDFKEKIAQIKK